MAGIAALPVTDGPCPSADADDANAADDDDA